MQKNLEKNTFITSPAIEAAVAAIVLRKPEPEILVLKRKAHPRDPWSGHYAFPGGRRASDDISLFATCLRETEEECGIRLSLENLVKKYPVRRAGNHLNKPIPVTTYLFELPTPPQIHLQYSEISCYEWIPLCFLAAEDNLVHLPLRHGDANLLFAAVPATEGLIWGFTYEVLMMLLADHYGFRLCAERTVRLNSSSEA